MTQSEATARPIRILIAKAGLDGHDRGAKVIARALRDAGMEVIYTGLHQTTDHIVRAAIQEDVDCIGLSILSGAHMTLFPELLQKLEKENASDIVVFGGGIIPKDDIVELKKVGIKEISCLARTRRTSSPGSERISQLIDRGVVEDTHRAKEKRSLTSLWRDALTEASTFVIHQALSHDPNRIVTHTVSSALRTAMKLAVSFRAETGHPPGTRIAILSDGFGELFPFYHAMWLLGMTVVTIPSTLAPKAVATHLNDVDAKVLVYSPSQMARLAKVIPHVSRLSHRLVCGELRAKESVAGSGSLSLQELLQNSERIGKLEDFDRPVEENNLPALIAFSEGKYEESVGVRFSMQALLAGAENQSWAYFRASNTERLVSLLPSKHVVSLIHTLLIPLVARILAFDLTQYESASRDWSLLDELIDNQVTAVITDEYRIREFFGLTKTKRVSLSKDFRLLLLPSKPVGSSSIEPIKDLVAPCYGLAEAGGLVSVGIKGQTHDGRFSSNQEEPTLTAGTPLGGVVVRISNRTPEASKDDGVGEISVQSEQIMSGYHVSAPGRASLSPEHVLFTGDRGCWYFDNRGRAHVAVLGREKFFFRRKDVEINMCDLEAAILKVIGVKDVRVVPFPHAEHGEELAAFVVVLAQHKGSVTREGLWKNLLRYFPWEFVPKVFMIADENQIQAIPSRSVLQEKLAAFSTVDFSRSPRL